MLRRPTRTRGRVPERTRLRPTLRGWRGLQRVDDAEVEWDEVESARVEGMDICVAFVDLLEWGGARLHSLCPATTCNHVNGWASGYHTSGSNPIACVVSRSRASVSSLAATAMLLPTIVRFQTREMPVRHPPFVAFGCWTAGSDCPVLESSPETSRRRSYTYQRCTSKSQDCTGTALCGRYVSFRLFLPRIASSGMSW
jgi:hypothetical protein